MELFKGNGPGENRLSSWHRATLFVFFLGMVLIWIILEGTFNFVYPQQVDFENLGSNQLIVDYQSNAILFTGTYATNYGSRFNVNGTSLFTYKKNVEVSSASTFDAISVEILQVSGSSSSPLVIEGYRQGALVYINSFSNLSMWQKLYLNYYRVDALLFRVGDFDYNLDNLTLQNSGPALINVRILDY